MWLIDCARFNYKNSDRQALVRLVLLEERGPRGWRRGARGPGPLILADPRGPCSRGRRLLTRVWAGDQTCTPTLTRASWCSGAPNTRGPLAYSLLLPRGGPCSGVRVPDGALVTAAADGPRVRAARPPERGSAAQAVSCSARAS